MKLDAGRDLIWPSPLYPHMPAVASTSIGRNRFPPVNQWFATSGMV